MTFTEEEDAATRIGELAANTFAYHLAGATKRGQPVAVFRLIATSILEHTDGPQRAIIRRSPLPPAAVADLQAWLVGNIEALAAAAAEDRLLDAVSTTLLAHTNARSISSLSDADVVPLALAEWVAGRSYTAIHDLLVGRMVRVSGDGATVEDAVALCENGFGYDVAMVVASLADLAEPLDPAGAAGGIGLASASGEERPDRQGRPCISGSRLCRPSRRDGAGSGVAGGA